MKRLCVILIFITTIIQSTLPASFILTGKVIDETQKPIELASIICKSQGRITISNLKGEFSMHLKSEDSVIVRVSMLGYKTRRLSLKHPKGKIVITVLMSSANTLGEIVVTEKHRQDGQTQDLDAKDLKFMPSANGNTVENMIQSQAGVSTHNELSTQYNVRGGSFDENSVYINGIEVYRPLLIQSGQQEGLSVINPDMVDKIGFSTGGFEAKYDDKMSSALDITYKKPTTTESKIQASLLGASCYIGLASKKISWINGIRYKTNRSLLNSLDTKGEYNPTFFDYQSYLSYKPNKLWNIDLLANISNNCYNFTPTDRETDFGTLQNVKKFKVYFDGSEKDIFDTYFGALSATCNINNNTKISFITSAFYTKEQETYDIQGQYWLNESGVTDNLGIGTYMEHARNYIDTNVESIKVVLDHISKGHHILSGLTYKIEHVRENSNEYEMKDSSGYSVPHTGYNLQMIYSMKGRNILNSSRIEAFIQDTYKFKSQCGTFFTLNYGFRFSRWSYNGESLLSPRLALSIIPEGHEDLTLRFATGLYYQSPFFKEIRDTTTTNGVTVANLNNKIKSQRSIHFILGLDYRFKINDRKYKFTAETYYKALSNLIPYNVDNMKIIYYGNNQGTGHAMGIDLKLYGEFVPETDSWISFSLMNTRENINGKSIPLPTDQRYALNFYFTDYFPGTERWKMLLNMSYADGFPFSAPHKGIEDNNFRAPAYKRIDIGMSYRLLNNQYKEKKCIVRNIWLGIDCLNLLGISNVSSYYWIANITNQQYAVPNYLTGRQFNAKLQFEF